MRKKTDKGFRKIRDERVKEQTGKFTEGWEKVLDAFNVRKYGHTAAAKHLREKYHLNSWWAQVVVIRYEYVKNLRS